MICVDIIQSVTQAIQKNNFKFSNIIIIKHLSIAHFGKVTAWDWVAAQAFVGSFGGTRRYNTRADDEFIDETDAIFLREIMFLF